MGLLWCLRRFLSANLCLQKQASNKHGHSSPRLEFPDELGARQSWGAAAASVTDGKERRSVWADGIAAMRDM